MRPVRFRHTQHFTYDKSRYRSNHVLNEIELSFRLHNVDLTVDQVLDKTPQLIDSYGSKQPEYRLPQTAVQLTLTVDYRDLDITAMERRRLPLMSVTIRRDLLTGHDVIHGSSQTFIHDQCCYILIPGEQPGIPVFMVTDRAFLTHTRID